MGKPKKQTSMRKTGFRRSHHLPKLAERVNALLSRAGKKVKVFTKKAQLKKASQK